MSEFKTITPGEISTTDFHGLMLGGVIPRPIGLVSTIDKEGNVNLSPFSFFNCFGSNPPTLIFSPSKRVRDNTHKHTLENVREVSEVVIGIVNYEMVEQMSLSSTEYEKGVNEFVKSGLTPIPSDRVAPPRVKECKVSFECKVNQVIETGQEGGAGNLVICEVLKMHVSNDVLNEQGKIDPIKMDAVARMGGDYYCRVIPESLFEVEKPVKNKGIGVDQLPEKVKKSTIFNGNDKGKLGNISQLPEQKEIQSWEFYPQTYRVIMAAKISDREKIKFELAKKFLDDSKVTEAWMMLLMETD